MKKTVFVLVLLCALCATAFAQNTIYVSAKGDDDNWGRSEDEPFKTLWSAFLVAIATNANITVIGTLDMTSEKLNSDDACFGMVDSRGLLKGRELVVTGKSGASGTERAVLSGKGSKKTVLIINNTKVRFEHIEISGGETDFGVYVVGGSQITMGTGAVVRDNMIGIIAADGANFVIDGGVVSNNIVGGISVKKGGILTLRTGSIRDNRGDNGGGVAIDDGGRFTMSGGTISGNRATNAGGGVAVLSGGRFDQTGGTISGNSAGQGSNPNIYRQQGSLGSNL